MTGTPSGVAAFMVPSDWLRHGDIGEIEVENIGRIKYRVVFEQETLAKDRGKTSFM
jgi:hypothetical protein